jgi:hypothetical protein
MTKQLQRDVEPGCAVLFHERPNGVGAWERRRHASGSVLQ